MTLAPLLSEAADSLAKASTPEPFSTSRKSNWVARAGGLPDYIQHIAHDLMEKRGKTESNAIQMAIGIVKNWASGLGKVDQTTRAAARKAWAEWVAKKASAHAKSAVQASLEPTEPSFADELAVRDAALTRLAVFEQQFSVDGMVSLLGEGMLAEAAAWSPTMKRTACAPDEMDRHEVYDGGQHVGTISRRKGFRNEPDRYDAYVINGQRVTDYNTTRRPDALKAIETHLEEAPARVIALPAAGKYLVAQPSSYSGQVAYKGFPTEQAARHAAGLPAEPTLPERNSKVEAVAEMLRFDLMTISGLDIPPLRRVQEARRRDPFDLVIEAFDPGEIRDFRGRWERGVGALNIPKSFAASVPPGPRGRGHVSLPAAQRYEGGVERESAKARKALAAKPSITHNDLPGSVGSGSWSKAVAGTLKDLKAGKVPDTEHAYREKLPGGKLGHYSKERTELHQRIIERLFQGKAEHPGKARAIFTAGGPASGKSEQLLKKGVVNIPKDAVHIDPDLIKSMLPEYQALIKQDDERAAAFAHEESSHIAQLARALAMGRQHHMLIDSVGDSEPGKFAKKIVEAKNAGHEVEVHYATQSVERALMFARQRAQETKRHVNEDFLRNAHRAVSQRFAADVSKLPVHIKIWDTTHGPRLIAEKPRGSDTLSIKDAAAYRRFLAKGVG